MDRRSFFIGAGSTIITAGFYKDVLRHVARKSAPLILPPDDNHTELYAVADSGGGYDLYLGAHPLNDFPPDWTWREFAGDPSDAAGLRALPRRQTAMRSASVTS